MQNLCALNPLTFSRFRANSAGSIVVSFTADPGDKAGNNVWCDLTPEAVAIIKAMPKVDDRIFPFTTDAITAAFTRASYITGDNLFVSGGFGSLAAM